MAEESADIPKLTVEELEEPATEEEEAEMQELAAHTAEHVVEQKHEVKEHTHILTLDVAPEEEETDLAKLAERIKAIKIDGLAWTESHLENVVYDVNKLRLTCTVHHGTPDPNNAGAFMEGPSIGALREEIEKIEGVQSTDVVHYKEVKEK